MRVRLKFFILIPFLCCLFTIQAQVSKYTFSQKVVDVSGWSSYLVGSGVSYLENLTTIKKNAGKYLYLKGLKDTTNVLTGKGFPIGFDFNYDGQWMDWVGISGNCYIKLGNSKDNALTLNNDYTSGSVFSSGKDTLRSNVICGMQKESSIIPDSTDATICYSKTGYPGNRRFCVEVYYPGNGISFVTMNLQEWKNQVQIYYGIYVVYVETPPTFNAYCGLRGRYLNNDTSNLNIRKVTSGTNTWSTSVAGDSATSHCDYKSGLTPTSGLVYTFTSSAPDTLRAPTAFFECNSWDSIPNFISIDGSSTTGYVLAKGATEIPTNPILYWSPEYTSSTNYYKLYLGTDSLDMTLQADSLTATQYDLSTLATGTTYYYKIIAYNAAGAAKPTTGSFTTAGTLSYCSPMYARNAVIQTVTLNTLKYTYQATTTSEGTWDHRRKLPDESPYTTTLQRDSTYPFSVTYVGNSTLYYTRCWIDFNHDGVFSTSSEQFNEGSSVKVPSDAILGTTTMRVGYHENSSSSAFIPCSVNVFYQDYTVTIAANDGCKSLIMSPTITRPTCYGAGNGSINLNLSGGTTPYTIKWEKGSTTLSATTSSLSNLGIGTYQAFVTDKNSCSVQTALLALTQPYPVRVDTSTVADSLEVSVSGGTTPYTYKWLDSTNKVVATTIAAPDSTGIYTLIVTDSSSCDITLQNIKVVKKVSGINLVSAEGNTLIVYPNPAKGEIQIQGTSTISRVEITDITGKTVYTKNKLNSTEVKLNMSALPAGVYVVKAYTNGGQETGEVIKQ